MAKSSFKVYRYCVAAFQMDLLRTKLSNFKIFFFAVVFNNAAKQIWVYLVALIWNSVDTKAKLSK